MKTRQQRQLLRLTVPCLLAWALLTAAPLLQAQSLPAGSLSRWLNRDVIPELATLLSSHPRYRGQRIYIQDSDRNQLTRAIANMLGSELSGRGGITLVANAHNLITPSDSSASIDELVCTDTAAFDYLLQVSVSSGNGGSDGNDRARLVLVDASSGAQHNRYWRWQGAFNSAERRQLKTAATPAGADGSLEAPWGNRDVTSAARLLSRELACALRPQIRDHLALQWVQPEGLAAMLTDTLNTTRHRLGDYRELAISDVQPDYRIAVRTERYRDDVWQLWISGTPLADDLLPVQAVTYFRQPTPAAIPAVPRPVPEDPLQFIDVQVVDATQTDRGFSRADLQVTLRLSNRAALPIAYSFTLSGGHFEQCIARPGYYRHDDYGLLSGTLQAGASELRRLVIRNARHRPVPLYGVPKCAGFRDLQGFEEFASQGHRVTDYVRWDM